MSQSRLIFKQIREEMCHIQQNTSKWKACLVVKKSAKSRSTQMPNHTRKRYALGYLMTEIVWGSSFENNQVWEIAYC